MAEETQNNEQVIYESSAGDYDEYIPDIGEDAEIGGALSNNDAGIGYFIENGNIKEAFSEDEIMSNNLMEPINPLDPKVYHDPPYVQPFVAKLKNTTAVGEGTINMTPDRDNVRVDAISVPVVRLNTMVLEWENIDALTITYTKFLPELTLIAKDPAGKFGLSVRPGLNNIIQVIIMPSIDGKYKKISLPFYITDVDVDIYGERTTYTGVVKHMPLIQQLLNSESINYKACTGGVDPADKCIDKDSEKPNMWQLFHEIAERSDLGFAAMPGLKDYNDHSVRNICSQNYKEFLEYNLSIGGLNETMIYDGWVDLYGYLVLVDVYKALHDDIQPNNLAMYAQTGLHTHNVSLPDEKYSGIRRLLTNSNMTKAKSNLEIEEFYNTSNIGEIREHGTLNTIYYFCPFGNHGMNNILPEQVRIKEDSADGEYVEDYEVQRYCGWSFVGCEDFNISRQMEIRNAYLTKLRNSSGRLTVRLANPNFALQRGTLVTIVRMRYDYEYKMRMLNSESNLYPGAQERGFKPDPSSGEVNGIRDEDILHNDGVGVIGAEDSGIYYIDGMRFDYINGNEKIQQYLYLIKRDPLTSLSNLSTWDKIKDPQS